MWLEYTESQFYLKPLHDLQNTCNTDMLIHATNKSKTTWEMTKSDTASTDVSIGSLRVMADSVSD